MSNKVDTRNAESTTPDSCFPDGVRDLNVQEMSTFRAMSYFLRPATNDDRAGIEFLVFAALDEHGLKADPASTDSDLHDIEASYFAGGGTFDLLVNDSGEIVGSVGLCRVEDSVCELRKMYLAPEARGSGWGRRLLEHALARASELEFRRVVLETASVLRRAIEADPENRAGS